MDPPQLVRIVGITPEHGLLRTMPESRGGYLSNRGDAFIDLQPDGNSFDLMAGLIKAKQWFDLLKTKVEWPDKKL